jgi:hypothetical protein
MAVSAARSIAATLVAPFRVKLFDDMPIRIA